MSGFVGPINFRELVVDSSQRTAGTVSEPEFSLSSTIRPKQIQIIEIEIPNTAYNITDKNNKIDFIEPIGGGIKTITIKEGNYTLDKMLDTLTTSFNNTSPNSFNYTVTIDDVLNKLIISADGNFNLLWSTGPNSVESIHQELGFLNTVDLTSQSSYIAQNIYNLSGPNYLLVKCDQIQGINTEISSIDPTLNNSNQGILARVPIMVNTGDTIYYDATTSNPSQMSLDLNGDPPKKLNFRLEKPNGDLFDLNGLDWSMKLGIFNAKKKTGQNISTI